MKLGDRGLHIRYARVSIAKQYNSVPPTGRGHARSLARLSDQGVVAMLGAADQTHFANVSL